VEVGAEGLVSCCVEGSCFMEEEERGVGGEGGKVTQHR
jgi:hypothetical protein